MESLTTHTHTRKNILTTGVGVAEKWAVHLFFFSFVLTSSRTLAAGLATYMYVSVVSVLTTEIPFFSLEMGKFTKYLHDTNETAIYVFVFFLTFFLLVDEPRCQKTKRDFVAIRNP